LFDDTLQLALYFAAKSWQFPYGKHCRMALYTETIRLGFFGYAGGLYTGIE
jgi:hypothetical protein